MEEISTLNFVSLEMKKQQLVNRKPCKGKKFVKVVKIVKVTFRFPESA